MDQAIKMPAPYSRTQNLMEVKPPLSNGGNTFLAGSFVKRSSALMAACATGDVVCLGWTGGPSVASGEKRPTKYWQANYPLSPVGTEFLINVTDSSGHVGEANGAPAASAVTIGSSYGIYRWTSGDQIGMQALNKDETSNTLFQVTALGPNTASGDFNGLVRVKVIDSKVQA